MVIVINLLQHSQHWECCSKFITEIYRPDATEPKQEKKYTEKLWKHTITAEYNHLAHTDVDWWLM